ncbi:MAG: DEAD/DEAH box helicase [Cellulophaga sp.]|nr:DEAD/DEAH box helicase [Cellulophaga sp.]
MTLTFFSNLNQYSLKMVSKLKAYLKNHSSINIRKRGAVLVVENLSKSTDNYTFSYKGSEKKPYQIAVTFNEKQIKSTCSCPYDFGGLCKHQVAAFNFVIDEIEEKVAQKDLFGNVIVTSDHDEIVLNNDLLTLEHIKNLARESKINYLHEFYIQLLVFDDQIIKTNYNSYPSAKQQFKYSSDTTILEVSCTCRESKSKKCLHILSALFYLVNYYGENIFSPEYKNIKKQEFLSQYGLSLEENYQKFFDLKFTITGLEVVKKVKNLVPLSASTKDNFLPKLTDHQESTLMMSLKLTNPGYGIGFCFNCYENGRLDYFNFFAFTGKYKKNTTEFGSGLKEIDRHNFMERLKDISEDEKALVLKALEFNQNCFNFNRGFSLETFRKAFLLFDSLLQATKEYPFFLNNDKDNFIKKNLTGMEFSAENPSLSFTFTENEDVFTLKPKITIHEKDYQIGSSKIKIFPFFCLLENTIYLFKTPNEYLYINRFEKQDELNFLKRDKEKLYVDFLKPISKYFEINTKVYDAVANENEENCQKQVYLSDYEGEYVVFKLAVKYSESIIYLHTKEQLFDEKKQSIIKRNETFESDFLEEFKQLHNDFQEQDVIFFLKPYQLIEDQWLLKASQKMEQKDILIFGAKDLKSFKYNLNKPTITMGVSAQADWFDLNIDVKFGNQNVSLKDIKKALLKKSNYVLLSDGTLGILPNEWLKKFSNYFKSGEVSNKEIKISNYQFNCIDELYEDIKNAPDFLLDLQRKQQQLLHLKQVVPIATPKQFKATLRPYQKEGLNWLAFLEENKLGGCLADDMGLGKTVQVIAFLAYLKGLKKDKCPHLVIAPTSLIFNWASEIESFCPSLKTVIYTGIHRKDVVNEFEKSDLILTTYGTVLNDIETLIKLDFNYVILDESQAIKNPNSKRYKSVRLLKSKNKLTLTGTPIENNTFDLYAQMNFLNPGLLGSMNHFKTTFSDAIDKEKNEDASQLLSRMIHPFLLRRTKKQVATELPEKTESILYCEMGKEQRKVYDFFKDKYRDYLLHKIDENGAEKSQMYVLEGLTKLRQICNSPALLNEEEDYGKSSVKLDLLLENIISRTKDHKVLVFSQFTSMLALIKQRLDNENIVYEYLDGKTQKREEKVTNFQETDEIRVFLISIKAGGVGLNLTAADYVFLVDPWWNPAVESQAIDRSYRIGQNKHVMAYKMICKDTIEEKILNLQKSKKQVSEAIIQTDKAKKSFSATEIKALFS